LAESNENQMRNRGFSNWNWTKGKIQTEKVGEIINDSKSHTYMLLNCSYVFVLFA
jgi:alkyl hydroperoxide reductase subunit AhpF